MGTLTVVEDVRVDVTVAVGVAELEACPGMHCE